MTAYSVIADGSIDQDSPVTAPLMTAIRDNPIAMFEGDETEPSTPKLQYEAFRKSSVGGSVCWTASAERVNSVYTDYPALDYNANDGRQVSIRVFTAGTIRARIIHRAGSASTSLVQVLKNGVLVQEVTTTNTSQTNADVDFSVAFGDIITIQAKKSGNDMAWTAEIRSDHQFMINSSGGV